MGLALAGVLLPTHPPERFVGDTPTPPAEGIAPLHSLSKPPRAPTGDALHRAPPSPPVHPLPSPLPSRERESFGVKS